jgi:hypothetical protein
MEVVEQQYPPRQLPLAQEELALQAAPGERLLMGEGVGEFEGVLDGVLEADTPIGAEVEVAVGVEGIDSTNGAAVLVLEEVWLLDTLVVVDTERLSVVEAERETVREGVVLTVGDGLPVLEMQAEEEGVRELDTLALLHVLPVRDCEALPEREGVAVLETLALLQVLPVRD